MPENIGRVYMQNGQPAESDSFCDKFLKLSAYIYEVFRVIDGIPLFLQDHLERFEHTIRLTGYRLPYNAREITGWVRNLIREQGLSHGNIKMIFLPEGQDAADFRIYIIEHQYPTPAQFRDGVAVTLLHGIRENPNAKVMDVELRQHTNDIKQTDEVYEVLLVDHEHCITEGSRSNVFFVFGNRVVTPPVDDVLPGITRKHIIACCLDKGIPFVEEKMPVSRLAEADAAFLSGTSRKVLPINRIDDMPFDSHNAVTRLVQHAFNNRVTVYLLRESLEG